MYYYTLDDNGKIWSAIKSLHPLAENQARKLAAEYEELEISLINRLDFKQISNPNLVKYGNWIELDWEIEAHRATRNS